MKPCELLLIPILAGIAGCSTLEKQSPSLQSRNQSPVGTDGVFQGIVENEVESCMKLLHPKRMVVIALDPRTGQILAECSRRGGSERQTEDAATWVFEPGSAFKPFVVAAALEDGYVSESSRFDCGHGSGMFSGLRIKDHVPLGEQGVAEILQKSSNVGMARIGTKIPDCMMDHYAIAFGFGSKTGIPRPDEAPGFVPAASGSKGLTKVRMSIGQSVTVTPIQVAMAYGTIVNGGVLLKPQDAWNDPPTRVRRVISDKTASTIRAMLGRVVSMKGTAPLAKLDGVSAGGKTGTAQVILPGGRYSPDRYVTLFAGFYPVEKPRVVCVVVVDQAQVSPDCNYGGLIAAPVFARICNHAVKCGF